MYSFITLIFYVILAELLRRCCLRLLHAFTGPLAKVPGPFLSKLTNFPWMIDTLKGNHMHAGHELFKKYGGEQ